MAIDSNFYYDKYKKAYEDHLIGERLKTERESLKMSQEELGNYLHIQKQSISNWELGKSIPSIDNIIRLCGLFHCSIEYLLCLSSQKQFKAYNNAYHLGLTAAACTNLQILTYHADSNIMRNPQSKEATELFDNFCKLKDDGDIYLSQNDIKTNQALLDLIGSDMLVLMFINTLLESENIIEKLIEFLPSLFATSLTMADPICSDLIDHKIECEYGIITEIAKLLGNMTPNNELFLNYLSASLKRAAKKVNNANKEPSEREEIYTEGDIDINTSRIIH